MEEVYIDKFHNLRGRTIAEHRKKFYLYMSELKSLTSTEIETVLRNIIPKNYQEEIFQIDLLSTYNKYERLHDILLISNKYLNKKLTRNLQLIKHLIKKYPPQKFIDDLCPKISYVTRINIINKLSSVLTNSRTAEKYFNAIFERYGVKQATPLLIRCGSPFIKQMITEHNLKIKDKDLIYLHGKYRRFAEYYFSIYSFNKYKRFGSYLAVNDVNTFSKLANQGVPSIGRTGIYNFMINYKKQIIDNPEKYTNIFNPRVVSSIFNYKEYEELISNLLPISIDDFNLYEVIPYIKTIPPKIRGKILFETYEKNYKSKFNEVSVELLDLLLLEDRLKFELEYKFPEYLHTEKSINIIKGRINFTNDVVLRTELITQLLKTCKINNAQNALLEVLEYVVEKHKNVPQFRQDFLIQLFNQFKLETLSKEHWKYIEGLLKISEINCEDHWIITTIYEKLIEFKHNNHVYYINDLKKYVIKRGIYGWDLIKVDPEVGRNCIINIGEFLNDITISQIGDEYELINLFFYTIYCYNKRNPKTQITYLEYPQYIRKIFKVIKEHKAIHACFYFYDLMTSEPEHSKDDELMNLAFNEYFDIKPIISSETILLWLLRNKPKLIKTYAELCFDNEVFKLTPIFYYEASKMHFNNISQTFKKISLRIVGNEYSKPNQIEPALIFLSNWNGYLCLLDKYQPTNYTIDIYGDNMKEILDVNKSVLKSLCCVPESTKSILTILPYCKGDYLQYALKALYKALYNIPQELIKNPIGFLIINKQSTKQGIDLASNLETSQRIREILTNIGIEEGKNFGKIIFKRTFKLLANFPNDDFWNLLVKHLQLINPNDNESFQLVMEVNKIPTKYRPQYIKLIWDYASKLKKQYQIVKMIKLDTWKQLRNELCEEILKSVLFNDDNENKYEIEILLYEYLLNGGNLSVIYNKLVETKLIYELLVNICLKLLQDNKRKKQALQVAKNLTNISSILPLEYHKYNLEILFESTFYFLQIEGDFLDCTVEFLLNKQFEAINMFGMDITTIYRDFAADFLKTVITNMETSKLKSRENRITDSLLEAAAKIAKTSDALHVKLLALRLIPRKQSKNIDFIKKRKEVVDDILTNCDEVVKVYVANAYYKEDI